MLLVVSDGSTMAEEHLLSSMDLLMVRSAPLPRFARCYCRCALVETVGYVRVHLTEYGGSFCCYTNLKSDLNGSMLLYEFKQKQSLDHNKMSGDY